LTRKCKAKGGEVNSILGKEQRKGGNRAASTCRSPRRPILRPERTEDRTRGGNLTKKTREKEQATRQNKRWDRKKRTINTKERCKVMRATWGPERSRVQAGGSLRKKSPTLSLAEKRPSGKKKGKGKPVPKG